ncbi:MAG: VWA domain-containing protein [Planctomycetaceae bacterium]|nr:VWA domain-containing protein [Planctomycetaceae bacterium]
MSSITFEPLITPALWIALALLAAGVTAWYARTRPSAVTRRRWCVILFLWSAGLAAVLFILLNPTWLEPVPPPAGKPLLTILIDQSASMAVEDAPRSRSRFAEASEIATQNAAKLSDRFDVRVRTFAAGSLPASIEQLPSTTPDGTSTDLAGALGEALASDRLRGQAILLVSDGIQNGPGGISSLRQALQTSRAMDVPVYTLTIGGDTTLRDIDVSLARPQELSFVGQNVPVPVVVRQRGRLTDRAEVILLKEGRPLARETVQLAADGSTPVRFHVTEPTSGLYRYEVRVEPQSGEATDGNNSATFLLRVIDDPVRVLLLEGKPYWDAKFLIRTLGGDPSVELDAIVRVSDTRFLKRSLRLPRSETSGAAAAKTGGAAAVGEADPPVAHEGESPPMEPARRIESAEILHGLSSLIDDDASLASYQLLVLGRDSEAFLSERMVERLREWVSRDGGALVCYRGAPVATANQKLARLLPVRWTPSRETRFRLQLTERGNELDWLSAAAGGDSDVFGKLPSLASSAVPENSKPQSVVLVRAQEEQGPAVVTYQPYGTGRVVAIEGSGMWRWAFLAPQFQEHDQTYSALWQSLLRWLVSGVGLIPGQDLVLRTDKVAFNINEVVSTMLLIRPEAERIGIPTVELTSGDGSTVGQFAPVPFGDEPGVYRVALGILPEGNYRATAVRQGDVRPPGTGATVAFDVRSYSSEHLDVKARPDIMARIAEESAGALLSRDIVTTLSERYQQHYARSRPEHVRRLTAWDRWWVLLGIVAAWGVAWGLRRSAGLV